MVETAEKMEVLDLDKMARMAMERNGLYNLLATIFRNELSADLLGHLLDADFLGNLADVGVNIEALLSLKPDETSLDDLSLEFSRLFIGPGKHVSPYESVHLGGEGGALWGTETTAVKRFIEKSGFSYDEKYHGLPDHISVEHEFMAHLTSLEAEAWRNGEPKKAINCLHIQQKFLDQHLGRWIESFSNKVETLAKMPFYAEMAKLARDFVQADNQELRNIDSLDAQLN